MYLIRIVISFIWVTGIFPLACDFNMLNKKCDTNPEQWNSCSGTGRPPIMKLIALVVNTVTSNYMFNLNLYKKEIEGNVSLHMMTSTGEEKTQ